MDSYELAKRYTVEELAAKQTAINEDPESWVGRKLTAKAAKKSTNMAWAIRTRQLMDDTAAGLPVPQSQAPFQ